MNHTTGDNLLDAIIESIRERKGHQITTIDLSKLNVSNAREFVIATGNTPTQVAAIADSVREGVQKLTGDKPLNYTGYSNATWIVIDYGYIMVHIFVPDARSFYDIETLWADGEFTNYPDLD